MALPVALYGAYTLGSMGVAATFRIASHPASIKAMENAYHSASSIGSSLSTAYGRATRWSGQAWDWLTGQPKAETPEQAGTVPEAEPVAP